MVIGPGIGGPGDRWRQSPGRIGGPGPGGRPGLAAAVAAGGIGGNRPRWAGNRPGGGGGGEQWPGGGNRPGWAGNRPGFPGNGGIAAEPAGLARQSSGNRLRKQYRIGNNIHNGDNLGVVNRPNYGGNNYVGGNNYSVADGGNWGGGNWGLGGGNIAPTSSTTISTAS